MQYAGLWLDHKNAVITLYRGSEHFVKHAESNIEQRTKSTGGSRGALPYTFNGGGGAVRKEHRRIQILKDFYSEISSLVSKVDKILVMGPGTAKNEFVSFVTEKIGPEKFAGVASRSKMTERQIAALTRSFFNLKNEPF